MNTSKPLALVLACLTLTAAGSAAAQTANASNNPNSTANQTDRSPPSSSSSTVPSTPRAAPSTQTTTKSDEPVTDTWITTKVKSELATTRDIKSMDISVKTVNGTVKLSGTQPTDMAVKKAITVAQGVKGVVRVDASGLKTRQ